MGTRHARNVAKTPRATLHSVVDIDRSAAERLASTHRAKVAPDLVSALADPEVDAVIITTPAGSHCELVVAAARAGKAIFCEKPLSTEIPSAREAVREVQTAGVPSFMGFMKRFEPSHHALIEAVQAGEVGRVEMVILTNRDPVVTIVDLMRETHETAPYTLLRESTVHDFDLARALLSEEPVEVYVMGSSLVDDEIAEMGEIDAAMTTLKTAGGQLCQINNIWRTVYGYDQRLEVFGSKGMLRAENRPTTSLVRYTADGALHDRLLSGPPDYSQPFLYKYAEAYPRELDHFIDAVQRGVQPAITVEDGFKAQLLVEAAVKSIQTDSPVMVGSP